MSAPSPVIARNMLEVDAVTRTFGSGRTATHALRGVSFSVEAGRYCPCGSFAASTCPVSASAITHADAATSGRCLTPGA